MSTFRSSRKTSYDAVGEFARLSRPKWPAACPRIATVERTIAKRKSDQVYVDAMQNARARVWPRLYCESQTPGHCLHALTWQQVEKGREDH